MTEPTCYCRGCRATFPTPAVARCPECGSNQVRRVPTLTDDDWDFMLSMAGLGEYESAPFETHATVDAFDIGARAKMGLRG